MQKTIFVVDDSETNLSSAKEALKEHHRVMTMPSAEKMFALIDKRTPDLILLDIEMPVMDGFQALTQLKSQRKYADIPVIFLTSMTNADIEARGFQLGVIDFINKPFSAPVLLNRLKTHLETDETIRARTAELEHKTRQLQTLQNGILSVLAGMVEDRDKTTGNHILRTSEYLEILIEGMKVRGVYSEELNDLDITLIVSSARLHDIGKISIPDAILNKPNRLTDAEFEIMKTHCTFGEHVIDKIAELTDDQEFLHYAKIFVKSHHEHWDGNGYPNGLEGHGIPLLGRIMSVVDVYDALTSERPYKKAMDQDQSMNIIMENAGTKFDPLITEVFWAVRASIKEVRA